MKERDWRYGYTNTKALEKAELVADIDQHTSKDAKFTGDTLNVLVAVNRCIKGVGIFNENFKNQHETTALFGEELYVITLNEI